jgi:sugar lactone lactonase YvrE
MMNRFCSLPSALCRVVSANVCVAAMVAMMPAPATAQFATVFAGSTPAGQSSAAMTVSIPVSAGGVATLPTVTSQGAAKEDFALMPGGTCAAQAYMPNATCTVMVEFTPQFPGVRRGAVQVRDSGGNLLGQALVSGNASGGLAVLRPGVIQTVAGNGDWIFHGDGGAATSSPLFLPQGVVEDAGGNLLISDTSNNRVRRVDAGTGAITTIAGTGTPGFSGDGGLAVNASLNSPAALVLDGAGDVFFADAGNSCIRRIDASTGVITTVAGVGGVQGHSGDLGLATAALLSLPEGLAMTARGDLYISDTGNDVVRRVDAATGIVTTVAGTGAGGYNGDGVAATSTTLNEPWGIALGMDGTLWIADLSNNRVRKVALSGMISTAAGTGNAAFSGDGSAAVSAELNAPAAVAVDPAGNVYVGDSGNNRVREVNAATGIIATVAGNSDESFSGDGGPATQASLYGPYFLSVDQSGDLLVADMFHNRIREVSATALPLSFTAIRVGKVSGAVVEGLENDGNGALAVTSLGLVNAALDPATTTCVVGSMTLSATCNLGVEFAPTVVGSDVLGSVTVLSLAANSPAVVTLNGQVLTVNPTSVALVSSVNPSMVAQAVTLTATVASTDTTLGGSITFQDGSTALCNAVGLSGKSASCVTDALALGTHNIIASYTGDSDNAAATSAALVQVVKQMATVVINASPNPAVVTTSVALSATVTAATGTPSGTVTFYDGSTAVGSAALNNGAASLATAQLGAGTHALTASYTGDATNAAAVSAQLSEVVNQAATVTTLATSASTALVGAAVTLTASVGSSNGPSPSGTVQFFDGTSVLASGTISSGVVSVTVGTLLPGAHVLTAVYGGDADCASSTSAAMTETIVQIPTVTLLSADVNPAGAGAVVTLTATTGISPGATALGALTGSVQFTDGTSVLGQATMDGNGRATLQTASLAVGSHTIVATYKGVVNYAVSASAPLLETVQSTSTVTSMSISGSGLAGQSLVLTAVVTSATGVPAGTVTFFDGTSKLGQAAANAQGVASFSVSSLAVGSHSLTAVYAGNASYVGSSSAAVAETVTLALPAITLVAPPASVNAGTAVSVTAVLSSNGVAPTGTLTLRDGGVTVSQQSVSGAGSATFTSNVFTVGTHTLTVAYSGDADTAAGVSNVITLVVQQGSTTTSLQTSKNPQVLGQALTLTAAVSSASPNVTGTLVFLDGTVSLGSAAVNGSGAAIITTSSLTAGSHLLTAAYTGDANHGVSTSAVVTEVIVQPVSVTLISSLNPAVAGAAVTFTAKVAGASGPTIPTGTVSFLDGTSLLGTIGLDGSGSASFTTSTLTVGAHSVTVSYAGDGKYAAGTSSLLVQTVANASTTIELSASANPATFGAPLSLTAMVTSNGGFATGSVVFVDGSTPLGTGTLDANGNAVLKTAALAPGTHTIVATYAGDGRAAASASAPLTVVVKQNATLALVSNANPSPTLSAVTLTATVQNAGQDTPGGVVSFMDGSTLLGTATLGNGAATLTVAQMSAMTHALTASYAGDATNFPAVSAGLSEVITLRPTSTALTATTDPSNDQQVTLIAVVRWAGVTTAPSGDVTFTNGASVVGSVPVDATGVATLVIDVGTASQTLAASYAGDANYTGSTSPVTTIGGEVAPQFTLALSPPALMMASKQHGALTMTLQSMSTFADSMAYGCLGLPFAATCTFSATQQSLKAGATTTVQLTVDTGDPLGAGATASVRSGRNLLVCFLPGALLAGFACMRRRRLSAWAGLAALLAMFTMFSASGCGGLQVNGTPAGTYSFQVTARGQNTGVAESQTVTLNVTN